jgi:hypothetical protein
MNKEELSYKIFLAVMIFNTNMFNRDELFSNIKEKFKIFSQQNQEISKYILAFSLFFSFTKDLSISFIGMILVSIFDSSKLSLISVPEKTSQSVRFL